MKKPCFTLDPPTITKRFMRAQADRALAAKVTNVKSPL